MTTPPQYSGWATGQDRAKLMAAPSSMLTSPGVVVFNYNPTQISFKRTPKTSSRATGAGSTGTILEGSELALITVNDLILAGQDTKARCDLLMGWCAPPASVGAVLGSLLDLTTELPDLIFQWGPPLQGFFYTVKLTDCGIKYERFDKTGAPVVAKVSLSLREQPSLLGSLPTNPSSGGLPGRSGHLVKEGDNLTGITTQHFGHPKHWRALAAANDIDDPLRVKPGGYVYIPNPSEIVDEE